jgi:ethylmalonyl-CoA mutase
VQDVLAGLKKAGIADVPVVVGGIIPPADAELLTKAGVARVYTPKDFDLTQIMRDIVQVVDSAWKEAA